MGQIFNKYLQDSEFWSTNNKAKGRDKDVMAISIRILEYLAILIKPYLPETSTTLLEILALNQYDIT
jgi:methionyl-tRNA synthetase